MEPMLTISVTVVRMILEAAAGSVPNFLSATALREAREIFERDYLAAQLSRFGGNISKTSSFVGMERSALHRKIKLLGLGEASRVEEH